MLTFISSDLLGRPGNRNRGFQLGTEYAASLMKMWGPQAPRDMPVRGGGGMRGGPQRPRPPNGPIFQEFGLKSVADAHSAVTIDVLKAGGAEIPHLPVRVGFSGRCLEVRTGRSAPRLFSSATVSREPRSSGTSSRA